MIDFPYDGSAGKLNTYCQGFPTDNSYSLGVPAGKHFVISLL